MDYIPNIFTYKNEAYVIHMLRGMDFTELVDEVCNRWSLIKEQVELKCMIPENFHSMMRMLNGTDIDRIPFGEQSSVSDNVIHTRSGNSSEEMRLRSDLWHDLIHSSNQTFSSVEQLHMDLSRYAISKAFDYHFIRNEQAQVTVACKVTTYQWSLHAIRIGCGPQFKIK
ncbi:hypothetical protein Taro_031295 [Colocasia esculenta]|uniref:Transposase MuDR plant domain-containing protein n=1 Tax=Colocasia esculenta TaxID=4460 RepID=A0A843W2R3_COLES|nr:hypothetical protein [Colocasia esculenta]